MTCHYLITMKKSLIQKSHMKSGAFTMVNKIKLYCCFPEIEAFLLSYIKGK
jgi:hypothetical protein